jgi:hypothetical protein
MRKWFIKIFNAYAAANEEVVRLGSCYVYAGGTVIYCFDPELFDMRNHVNKDTI